MDEKGLKKLHQPLIQHTSANGDYSILSIIRRSGGEVGRQTITNTNDCTMSAQHRIV